MNMDKSFYKSDIFLSILIFLIFIIVFIVIIYTIIKKNILLNIDKFRCDPFYMNYMSYFGINSNENFKYCVKNAQTEYMGHVLQPVNNSIDTLNESVFNLSDSINVVQDFVSDLRTNIGGVVDKIYNSMDNLAIQSSKIQQKNNDNVSRMVGAMTNSIYLLDQNTKSLEDKFFVYKPPDSNFEKEQENVIDIIKEKEIIYQ